MLHALAGEDVPWKEVHVRPRRLLVFRRPGTRAPNREPAQGRLGRHQRSHRELRHAALPFGGVKQSGINRYHGKIGLRVFTDYKIMVIDDGTGDSQPYWFPYTEAKLDNARKQFAGAPH